MRSRGAGRRATRARAADGRRRWRRRRAPRCPRRPAHGGRAGARDDGSRRDAGDARGRRRDRRALGRPGRAVARRGRRRRRRRTTHAAAVVARVALRYDDTKADLVHDEEYEAVLYPLATHVDVTTAVGRRLRRPRPPDDRAADRHLPPHRRADRPEGVLEAAAQRPRRPPGAQPGDRDPDEPGPEAVRPARRVAPTTSRRAAARSAGDKADAEAATLRDKYEAKVTQAAHRRSTPPPTRPRSPPAQQKARERDEVLSSAARSSAGCSAAGARPAASSASSAGPPGGPARRRRPAPRVDAAKSKVARLRGRAAGRRGRTGGGARRDRRPLGGRGATDRADADRPREDRRQGHPAGPGLDPRA